MENKESSIYDDYFQYTRDAQTKYGPKSVVLMQVGAFYEIYGLKTSGISNSGNSQIASTSAAYSGSQVADIAAVCGGLAISEKKATFGQTGAQIVMAGFRDYTIDRHVQHIVDAGFTALVYDQQKQGTKFVRVLTQVLSAGTYLPIESGSSDKITNHVMCVWIDVFNTKGIHSIAKTIVCGVAAVNIISGKSAMFEYQSAFDLSSPTTFDELERCIATFLPSELIFISPFDQDVAKQISTYAGIQCPIVHFVQTGNTDTVVHRCTQQVYLRHVLETYFQKNTYDVCGEFHEYPVSTQSYCYLLHFIHEHNANLIRKIELPDFYNGAREMLLANHTLKQLNIVDDLGIEHGPSSNHRSVAAFLNKCCTAIGKRSLFSQLTRPVFDVDRLTREYDATEWMLGLPEEMHAMMRKQLSSIADMEKIERQIVMKRATPDAIYRLYLSMHAISQMHTCFAEADLTWLHVDNTFSPIVENLISIIEQTFVFQEQTNCVNEQLFQKGVDPVLDELVETQIRDEHLFVSIRTAFNRIMATCEKSGAAIDYIKVHDTEKSGSTLQITKKRSAALKAYLAKNDPIIEFCTANKEKIRVQASEIRFSSAGTTNDEIEFPLLNRILRERLEIKDRILVEAARVFKEWTQGFEIYIPDLRRIVAFVERIDVLQSKSYVARKYNYCRPTIGSNDESEQPSFVVAKGLRHCLIEHIQTKEIYVPNDISIGNTNGVNGVLLYGTNAVGKTSLIRALGIATIMAQAGMYVPAASFHFRPYRAIFSRILGNDNLFKNLSTFAVEMSELRSILTHADQGSLVLGDELCSGTESESALSIFMAGLMDLNAKRASFLFATHFHEILKFSEMQEISRPDGGSVQIKHMAVHYDRELDRLVYDRVLRDGPGNRVYGLEVAKSLHLPPEFIETAYMIRQKYYPDTQGPLANTPTKYNSKKIRGLCEMCKMEPAEETHHVLQQKDADERGFIEGTGVHKNHPANLMGLCAKCHDAQHRTEGKAIAPNSPQKKVLRKITKKSAI